MKELEEIPEEFLDALVFKAALEYCTECDEILQKIIGLKDKEVF